MEVFKVIDPKDPSEGWYCDVDIAKWLDGDTIAAVAYTAKNVKTGADVTSALLSPTLSTFTGTHLRPYIQGGANATRYRVRALVTINESADIGVFVIEVDVKTW
jgi:hypothetical protein